MGKHERGTIQELEDSVASILSGGSSTLTGSHPWVGHDVALAAAIKHDYPEIQAASASGNTYGDAGDVVVENTDGTSALVELKASVSRRGKGTAANISQNALTGYGLFPNAQSWSDWRSARKYPEKLINILDEHPSAAVEGSIEAKGRALKVEAEAGDSSADAVIQKAKQLAHRDRRDYLLMLADEEPDPEAIRLFSLAIFMGAHTNAEITALQRRGLPTGPDEVGSLYGVYFTNVEVSGSIVVSRFGQAAIVRLLSVSDFRIELGGDGRATCRVLGRVDGSEREILRFILHWKNVFLGIKTPCINVFLGTFALELIE